MRKLATIQRVLKVEPIEKADSIEVVQIMGWKCVVRKGDFKEGDLGVYFEVDSFLPIEDRYEFLRKSSYRNDELNGEGFRIKTVKLRGQISQGLFLSMDSFPEIVDSSLYKTIRKEDLGNDDVTEDLGVKKWEVEESTGFRGTFLESRPSSIPSSDEVRIQSEPELLDKLKGRPYYITTKMDGTSGTVYYIDGEVGCCSRHKKIKEDPEALYWRPVFKYDLRKKLLEYNRPIVLIGEICGPGIQKNPLKLSEVEWFIFDVIDYSNEVSPKYLSYSESKDVCDRLDLLMVPLEEIGEDFNYTLDQLLEMARGKYPSGLDKEGIVVRDRESPKRVSFKVLNNDYLLKDKN